MRTSTPASVAALALAALLPDRRPRADAAAAPRPPAPDYTLTANAGLFSQYIFRGISQTAGKPAVQGGFDWAPFERLLPRHVGHRTSAGSRISAPTRARASSGISTAATRAPSTMTGTTTSARSTTTTPAAAIPASPTPTPGNSTPRSTGSGSARRRRTASTTTSARNPPGRRPTAPGISTSTPTIRSERPGFTLLGHFGILNVAHDGSGSSKASYNDWKLGASYGVPDGPLKGFEVGAYYSGNNAKKAFYTDLTGYNTAKDTGVVYVKKTF